MQTEEQLDEDGEPKTGEDGRPLRPLARVKKLFASDVVDEPAANENGFFGHKFFGPDVKLSAEATAFLNKFLEKPDAIEKALGFLQRYVSNRSDDGEMKINQPGDESTITEDKEMDKDKLQKDHPDLAESIKSEGFQAGYTEGLKEGSDVERKRIEEVQAQSIPGHEDLIEKLKFDGKTTGPEAAVQVLAAEKQKLKGVSAQISKDAPDPVPDQVPQTPEETLGNLPIEERCQKEWEAKAHIREEFGTLETYSAWKRAEEAGQIKILNGGK